MPDKKNAKPLAKAPGKAKLLASLDKVPAHQRARAGITQQDVDEAAEAERPTGVTVESGPFQRSADSDVEEQVRVIDHDHNLVLFSGTPEEFARLKKALSGKAG